MTTAAKSTLFTALSLPWLVVKIIALFVAIGLLCVLMAGACYVLVTMVKRYPWAALGAVPMVVAYAWAFWGHSPGAFWRLGIAVAVQIATLGIAQVIAG